MTPDISKTVKAGKRTYFFDVKEAKTGEKYLVVTESRFAGQGPERARSRIMIFRDALGDFVKTLGEVAQGLASADADKTPPVSSQT